MPQAPDDRLPVTLLTGFLGSGKTTLLGRAITHPALGRVAVIINEFGNVSLDHDLIEASSEDLVLLGNGCLCCSIRGNLIDTMRDLLERRDAGRACFDRVVIETSGLADPVPVLRMIESDPVISARHRLAGVVTTADAVNCARELDNHIEAVRQVAVADWILITKSDIAPATRVPEVVRRLRALNAWADIEVAVSGDIDPQALFCRDDRTRADRGVPPIAATHHDHAHACETDHYGGDHAPHDRRIRTFTLQFDRPLDAQACQRILGAIEALKGPGLLRVKGVLYTADDPAPLVLHAIQDIVHPVRRLSMSAGTPPISRIVFITWDLPRESVEPVIAAAGFPGVPS